MTLDPKLKWLVETFDNYKKTDYIKVTTKYQQNLGKCFSIYPQNHVLELGITSIDIVARTSIYVYMGYPGQFNFDTKTKVICVFLLFIDCYKNQELI